MPIYDARTLRTVGACEGYAMRIAYYTVPAIENVRSIRKTLKTTFFIRFQV